MRRTIRFVGFVGLTFFSGLTPAVLLVLVASAFREGPPAWRPLLMTTGLMALMATPVMVWLDWAIHSALDRKHIDTTSSAFNWILAGIVLFAVGSLTYDVWGLFRAGAWSSSTLHGCFEWAHWVPRQAPGWSAWPGLQRILRWIGESHAAVGVAVLSVSLLPTFVILRFRNDVL